VKKNGHQQNETNKEEKKPNVKTMMKKRSKTLLKIPYEFT